MAKTNFKTIDEYIQTFPKDVQKILEQIRQSIKDVVPDVEETISYQIPTFKLYGKYLVYFAGWKNHISLYPVTDTIKEKIKKEIASYKTSKGTLQFPLDKPMPLSLIKKIVKYKIKEFAELKNSRAAKLKK
jgi:uncharacterized protein YdhG (YjbR/CyaY superfamily)